MASEDTSRQSSEDLACREHGRRICPPCLFNCQKVLLNIGTFPLDIKDGLLVYMAYPRQALFTWSEQYADLNKLDALADTSRENRFDNYTVAENAGWYPLFIPQLDEQVVGAGLWDYFRKFRFMEFKSPVPDSPDTLDTIWCDICQLTWLKAKRVATSDLPHPRHQTLPTFAAAGRYLDVRSIIVHVDGVLPSKYPVGPVNAGIGVFFGEGSKYNQSEPFYMDTPSKQRAEFYSARHAMEVIKDEVIHEWLGHLKEAKKESETNHIRLIIATNSIDLVDTFTKRIDKWEWDRATRQYYRPGKGHGARDGVKNSDIIRTIYRQMENFKRSETGVETVWYHVDKKFNAKARALASSSAGNPVLP
ncbi:hypothetical protein F4820DRAFT_248696 [Hypoxylon rubiginosum]|uniref:Uncharacterized protein n=1 Tax=Hypoxylon rubiginosum TaxID=110542 RepID=A0ACB9Z4Y4_9PEZI|nr:hypothetical protein F4820DRAFT_248696 [Hypoxylon rubiginosum]